MNVWLGYDSTARSNLTWSGCVPCGDECGDADGRCGEGEDTGRVCGELAWTRRDRMFVF